MKTIKIVGIVTLIIALILIIIWAIKESMEPKDVVTGVKRSKIKKAAESVGIPKQIAEAIAEAPDSGAAARKIGVPIVLATVIANGVDVSTIANERTRPTNSDGTCPRGFVKGGNKESGYYCKEIEIKGTSSHGIA